MKKRIISFILSSAMLFNFVTVMPINAFAVSGDSKIYEKDGYTVTYSVGSEWDNTQTIEIEISNTGEDSILNWALKYDVGGSLSNLWNAKMYSIAEDYAVVKNNGYNYEIEPGQAVKYGYTLTSDSDIPAELPDDIEMFSRKIEVKSGYTVDFKTTSDWYTGFQGEISITNTSDEPIEAWTLSFNGNFDINNIWNAKLILSENRSYVTANQLWTTPINPGESASFGFTADKSAMDNIIADNFKLTAVVIGESKLENDPEKEPEEDIDYELDSDNDGLSDYYEDILGTDKNNPDTDGDGIPDGYEFFYLGTDPTKADSDDNGTNDGDEDFDNDGLSNQKEYELGTDPNNADTDGDGLSDGAEVNTHGTDPLKYDTDDDGISDGDELKLGLDPKNSSTDGTPDSERTFPQTISSNSEVLSEINNDEETPFKVSLEIKAAGVAENNVYARESGYSNAIENSAIIGTAPEFVYTDGLAVEEVTVKFELDNSIIKNTLGTYTAASGEFEGINRLNVFMFIEDVNMLLPVETFHDEATNTVYTTTDRMGTYCLVDMELWLDLLGIKPQNVDALEQSVDNFSASIYNEDNASVVKTTRTDIFDVVFMVDQVNYSNEQLDVIKDKIAETSTEIWKRTPEATVVIYGFNGDGKTHFKKYGRAGSENPEALAVLLDNLTHAESVGTVIISKAINHLITESDISENRIYCFTFFDSLYDLTEVLPDNSQHKLDEIKSGKYDVNISIVSNIPEESENNSGKKENYATALYNQTNGISIDIIDFVERSLKHIYGEKSNQFGAYNAIIATGYHTIVLDAPITIGYREAAEDVKKNPQNLERYKRSGMVDTDDDGLLDFQEINFEIYGKEGLLVQFDEEGYIKELPLATVCSDLYVNTKGKEGAKPLTYVEKGWKAFENSIYYSDLSEIHILPIISNPINPDGDNDGKRDSKDGNPLSENIILSQLVYNNNGVDDNNKDNIESLKLNANSKVKFEYEQKMIVDFSWFYNNPAEYNNELALASIIMAGLAYHTTAVEDGAISDRVSDYKKEYCYAVKDKKGNDPQILTDVMKEYEFDNAETINLRTTEDDNGKLYNDNHLIQFDIGHKDISQYSKGKEAKNLLAVFVRGTHGTEEWYSNFDIGNTDEWTNGTDWKTKENHMGFDIAAVRAKKEIDKYLSANGLNKNNTVIWLAGHSRGAAVSGIIATYLIADGYKVFAYNFATPNQVETTDRQNIDVTGVFNIINKDDLIPNLPLKDKWNFNKYGNNTTLEFTSAMENKWHSRVTIWYNQASQFTLNSVITAFSEISPTRNDCYNFAYDEDGNINQNMVKSYDIIQYLKAWKYYSMLPDHIKETFEYEHKNGYFYVYQKPIYFMQILAGVSANEEYYNLADFILGFYYAEKYQLAAGGMIEMNFAGIKNPHFIDAYIILCEV